MSEIVNASMDSEVMGTHGWLSRGLFSDRVRDLLLRSAVALWFFVLAVTFVRDIAQTLSDASLLSIDGRTGLHVISRSCQFFFFTLAAWVTLVRARPVAQAAGLQPRLSALLGSYLLFLLPAFPEHTDLSPAWSLVSSGLIVIGSVSSLAIVLRLGKSFSVMAEARKLVVGGPYAVIRHPLYLAEQVALVGVFIQFASLPTALLITAQFAFQIQRMRNEEAVLLRCFPDYATYMASTARLIPGLW
jgi:protein-S-isoprenylcysteine O-methyltransferase Ste14